MTTEELENYRNTVEKVLAELDYINDPDMFISVIATIIKGYEIWHGLTKAEMDVRLDFMRKVRDSMAACKRKGGTS